MQYYFFLAEEAEEKKNNLRIINLDFEFQKGDLVSQKLVECFSKGKTETCFFCRVLKIYKSSDAIDVFLGRTENIVGKKYRRKQTIYLTIPNCQPVIVLRKIPCFNPKTKTRKNCRNYCQAR